MDLNGGFIFQGTEKLVPQLERILNKIHSPEYMVDLIKRKPFDYRSTSPVEIISCRLSNEEIIYLFCKYSGSHTQYSYGHRGGVEYETKIYKNILNKLTLSSARFYGICKEKNKENCLVIEYLKGSKLLKDAHAPKYFGKAAAWIGNLHRKYESNHPRGVKVYDTDYYMIWLKEVETMLETLKKKYPWLPAVCRYFRDNIHLLAGSAQTFIHGEYYTKNILVKKGIVYPIDWESAAVGPGEIDLASLIEDWDEERKNIAVKKYKEARWPGGNFSGSEFEKRMLMVRIYFFLRWTGEYNDPQSWLNRSNWFNRFYQLIKEEGYKPLVV
jgi:thiamine kinase-like enzyme